MEKEFVVVVMAEFGDAQVGQDLLKVETVERRRVDVERIANEAEARVAFLRSRPMSEWRGLAARERAMIDQLLLIADRARLYLMDEREEKLSAARAADERAQLDKLSYAAVNRFSALLEALDESFPSRAAPQTVAKRAWELAEIERFLARERGAATGTDGK